MKPEPMIPESLLSKIVEQRAALMRIYNLSDRALLRPDLWLEMMREINKVAANVEPIGTAIPGTNQTGAAANPDNVWDSSKRGSEQPVPRSRTSTRGRYLDLEAAARRELIAKYDRDSSGGRA